MRKESFKSAEQQIKDYLYKDNLKAYTVVDIAEIFESNREEWNIAAYRRRGHFTQFLDDQGILKENKLKHQTTGSIKQIYTEKDAVPFDIGLTIKKEGFLSNYSAMQIHQLTLQIPKSIYVSFTKSQGYSANSHGNTLEQISIDQAFSKPQRITSEVYRSEIDNIRYYFIQKAFIEKSVGIISESGKNYTDLERTLIDIAIRPAYSGGVFEVLEAFTAAKEIVDIYKLDNYLTKLDYLYPYHQLIGFYMDKAGYNEKETAIFHNKKRNYNFYLTYNMSNTNFDEKWKLYYPKGF